jgi:NAD-dependent deacetylase
MDDIRAAQQLVAGCRRIVVLTGAGISTDSGIPDFRGPQGVWTKNPQAERLATLQVYMADPSARRQAWRNRLNSEMREAKPNAGHRAVAELEKQGRLLLLVTQNVDGLHLDAGNSAQRTVEIHGTVRETMCLQCGARGPMDETLERVKAGEADPHCLHCGGMLKSATVSFGQNLFPGDMERSEAAAQQADLMLAVGSSLGVYPAAGVVPAAVDAGAKLVIVNAQPTPFDDAAQFVLRGNISEVLPQLVKLP